MEDKIRLGISSCLLGNNVRFDGGHKMNRYLHDTLAPYVEYVPVCPEVEIGLPTPAPRCVRWLEVTARYAWYFPKAEKT